MGLAHVWILVAFFLIAFAYIVRVLEYLVFKLKV